VAVGPDTAGGKAICRKGISGRPTRRNRNRKVRAETTADKVAIVAEALLVLEAARRKKLLREKGALGGEGEI